MKLVKEADRNSFEKCPICGITFSRESLGNHMTGKHRQAQTIAKVKTVPVSNAKEIPVSSSQTVTCDLCGRTFTRDYIHEHKRRIHAGQVTKLAKAASTVDSHKNRDAQKSSALKPGITNYKFIAPGHIKLISKRGMRVGAGRCAECGTTEIMLWRYAESNLGPVCLCSRCKVKVFDRSFGKGHLDLLDMAYRG